VAKPDSTDDDVKTTDATGLDAGKLRDDADLDKTDDETDGELTDDELTDDELTDDELDEELDEDAAAGTDDDDQSPQTALFWADTEVDPVEIVLPGGTGLTLRHYRTVEDEDGDETEEAVFLAHNGKLHLFRSPEGLLAFINSDAPHDLTDLETWPQVQRRATVDDLVAIEDDTYELDLVVENLRGGHDVWEPELIIAAGELARDVAFACQLEDVLAVLAPGSPLDDLDEGLRNGGFLARRRLKKIGAEQAAIGWRGVIGKITAAVEWHD
jgi:hypothetical protein